MLSKITKEIQNICVYHHIDICMKYLIIVERNKNNLGLMNE